MKERRINVACNEVLILCTAHSFSPSSFSPIDCVLYVELTTLETTVVCV